MKLRDANLQVCKKTPQHILLHVFCLHFLRAHCNSSEEALKVYEQNTFQEIYAKSSITCNLSISLRFI